MRTHMHNTRHNAVRRNAHTRKPNGKPEGMDKVRAQLAARIGTDLAEQGLTQTQAAYLMHDAPSQISLVVTGKLRGFSTDRLLRMLNGLGRDVDIVVKGMKRGAGKTRLTTKAL